MFYPSESLKKGGRFYWCWLADSWPLQFASITQRQLWSQDIRKICDDLQLVVNSESGHPTNRFSLRLSSQLLRGLTRLYNKKVTTLTAEICTINAKIIKHVNKKWMVQDITEVQNTLACIKPLDIIQEVPQDENEEKIEEIIQQSGNVVANIDEITIKEVTIPEIQLPINDGFGEETVEQELLQLAERSVEQMLHMPTPDAMSRSAFDLDVDKSYNKSHDRSRLAPRDFQMERLSEHDVTMFNKSIIQENVPSELERDIPRTPEIPCPVIHAPSPEKMIIDEQEKVVHETPKKLRERAQELQTDDIELQELGELEPPRKRRRVKKLIIDKQTQLSSAYFRARLQNNDVELRCQNSYDDIINVRVPAEMYFRRPACAGSKIHTNVGYTILQTFSSRLGFVKPGIEREPEQIMARTLHTSTLRTSNRPPTLEQIIEVEEPCLDKAMPQDITEIPEHEMPTQILEMSQGTRRLTMEKEGSPRKRAHGHLSFSMSQRKRRGRMDIDTIGIYNTPPKQVQTPTRKSTINMENQLPQTADRSVAIMLQEAGIADIEGKSRVEKSKEGAVPSQRKNSYGSETPLGSLDRTKVSLGDSVTTTESKHFINDEWGTEGTMMKILKAVKNKKTITVHSLVAAGPIIPGRRSIIAARCFVSMLKLNQHGFIRIIKHSDTSEIAGVQLGPKFEQW